MKARLKKEIIGRLEKISLPEFNLYGIDAKVDTGAYTSSLHCHDIFEDKKGKKLYFKLLDPRHPYYNGLRVYSEDFSKTKVKSSVGVSEYRYKIKTILMIGTHMLMTEFTLTNRSGMRFPVLLGRKAFKGKFLVDARRKYLMQ